MAFCCALALSPLSCLSFNKTKRNTLLKKLLKVHESIILIDEVDSNSFVFPFCQTECALIDYKVWLVPEWNNGMVKPELVVGSVFIQAVRIPAIDMILKC